MEIIANVLTEISNNTFLGTLFAGLILGSFSINYFYKKQKDIDSSDEVQKSMSSVSVQIKRELTHMRTKQKFILYMIENAERLSNFSEEESTKMYQEEFLPHVKKITSLLDEIELQFSGTKFYTDFISLQKEIDVILRAYKALSLQAVWSEYGITPEQVLKFKKEIDCTYPKLNIRLESYISKM